MEMFLKMVGPALVWLAPLLVRIAKLRPYFHLTNKDGSPYMNRWWLVKPSKLTRGWSIRVHEILSSDDDRALHDHPWQFHSLILQGGYREIVATFDTHQEADEFYWDKFVHELWDLGLEVGFEQETGKWVIARLVAKGDVNSKGGAHSWHRLRLIQDLALDVPATTLFICGPKTNSWGFLVNGVKVPWKTYLAKEFGTEHVAQTEKRLAAAFGVPWIDTPIDPSYAEAPR